jgi:NitT/TauT family transport system substrate-binding protein
MGIRRAHRQLIRLLAAASLALAAEARAETVRVVVPDADNLQYMPYWLAEKGGELAAEGLTIETRIPAAPRETIEWIRRGEGDAFVLPPPVALELAAEKAPFVLVANLLRNDPIDLIVRGSVAKERGLSRSLPLKERLLKLKGLKVGVAPGPPPRLEALFASVGLAAKEVIEVVIVPGKLQNTAFAEGKVDALYAHTPYLEKALVEQGAELLVDQAGGEVPTLARMQIHALAVRTAFRDGQPTVVEKLVRAIARAERRLTSAPEAENVEALAKAFPTMRRENLAAIVHLYRPAIPETPAVSASGLAATLPLYPLSKTAPTLTLADLAPFVDDRFTGPAVAALGPRAVPAEAAKAAGPSTTRLAALVALLGAVAVVGLRFSRLGKRG